MILRSLLIISILLFSTFSSVTFLAKSENNVVVVIKLDGVINFAALDLVKEGFNHARETNASAIILLLNTPGGLWDVTRDIIGLIEESRKPIISFVYPRGASAWSAGTFILLSSHVAAMAPYSIIGSCQPRAYPSGELVDDPKMVNALREFLVQRAEMHGRNQTIIEDFVTKNRNMGAEEAKNQNVVDCVASDIEELLVMVDGLIVRIVDEEVTMKTKNAQIYHYGPSIRVQVLRVISDPTIAYLLFILGVWGIIFGFLTIGFEGEIIGGILLILGLIGLGFYVDLFVIILLVLGGVLVYVEMREHGLQFFGPAGVFYLLVGSLLLLRLDPARWLISPGWYTSFLVIVLALIAIIGGFSIIVLYKIFKSAKKRPEVLKIVGETATTLDEITPEKEGFVRFHGEHWKARSKTTVTPGQKVKIVAKEGLTLTVEPIKEDKHA